MIESFVLRNMSLNRQVTFGQEPGFDYLYKSDDGIDWGNVQAQHNTYAYPGQVGVSISSSSLKERSISIVGYAYHILSDVEKQLYVSYKDRVEYAYKMICKKKGVLNELVNPLQIIRLKIGGYYIEGKPSSSVTYGTFESDNNKYYCKFTISLYCNNPMFKKETEVKTILSGSIPKFHFPWILSNVPKKGTVMSVRRTYQLIPVDNEGTVEVGCKIILFAKGEVSNPRINNVHTGESLAINKTMIKGEKIVINTNEGEKEVRGVLDDIEMNYFKYWDYENDWMKFPIGTTLVGYSVNDGMESLLDVSIELNPMKLGLEEM